MPFRLAAVGFDADNPSRICTVAEMLSNTQEPLAVPGGFYLGCAVGQGIELWLQFDANQRCIGAKPHFVGEGDIRVMATEPVDRPGSVLEGALFGWAAPQPVQAPRVLSNRSADSQAAQATEPAAPGAYPLVFDVPTWATLPVMSYPAQFKVQLAGFAQEMAYFPSATAMRNALGENAPTGPTFVPTGLMRPVRTPHGFLPPDSIASITGVVLDSEQRINPHTYLPYIWTLVQTEGGTVDLLCPSAMLADVPSPGGWIHGSFWLSGQVMTEPDAELPTFHCLN